MAHGGNITKSNLRFKPNDDAVLILLKAHKT